MQGPEAKHFKVWSLQGPCEKTYQSPTHRRSQLHSGPGSLRRLARIGRGRVRAAARCHGAVTEAGRGGPVARAGRRLVRLRAATRTSRGRRGDVGVGTRGGLVSAPGSSRRGGRVTILGVVYCNMEKRDSSSFYVYNHDEQQLITCHPQVFVELQLHLKHIC